MSSQRKWNVFLPNGRKLELKMQVKHTGKDLIEIVAQHLNLKEKEYFGIMYDVDGLYNGWLNEEKSIIDHDITKKSRIDFYFSVKFFVESVTLLNHAVTAELYFLHIRSLIYKGSLETDDVQKIFSLAAYVLQITCGDYESDEQAISQLKSLPVLPKKTTRSVKPEECERAILNVYKKLAGFSKGKAIIDYLTIVESLPTYGLHYFKVKDKSGVPWYLGISYKGISQFDIQNKLKPTKIFHWRQLENIYYKEKKFTIEVNEASSQRGQYKQQQQQQHNTASRDSNKTVEGGRRKERNWAQSAPNNSSNDPSTKTLKTHSWYASSNSLIKNLFSMSINQHRFYLDRKQSKGKLHNDSSRLDKAITANTRSLIEGVKQLKSTGTPTMTRKTIKDVDVTEKKGTNEETPELREKERDVVNAWKSYKTELEDRLYDKVQELKKICLQESEFTGKLPKEYIRYMDLNEKVPKVKKRFGAEYKVKLNTKDKTSGDYQTTVTAASSYSSGFGSDVNDGNTVLATELTSLETEASLLEQICKASHTLAKDSKRKKIREKNQTMYKSTLEKLKKVEDRISELRVQIGHKPAERASMLFADDFDYTSYEDSDDAKLRKYRNGTPVSSGSVSPDASNEDGVSLSSGGDALSTRSTPALTNKSTVVQQKQHPASTALERRRIGSNASSIKEGTIKRSLTPPPNFRRGSSNTSLGKFIPPALASSTLLNNATTGGRTTLQRSSPIRASHDLLDKSTSAGGLTTTTTTTVVPPKRNWTARKWERPKTQRGWSEAALDHTIQQQHAGGEYSAASTCSSDHVYDQSEAVNLDDRILSEVTRQNEKMSDEDAMSQLSIGTQSTGGGIKRSSTPNAIRSRPDVVFNNGAGSDSGSTTGGPVGGSFRKRSSSFDGGSTLNSEQQNTLVRPQQLNLKLGSNPTYSVAHHPPSPQTEVYNVPLASPKVPNPRGKPRIPMMMQTPIFDTNVNIRMQYIQSGGHPQPVITSRQGHAMRVGYGMPPPVPTSQRQMHVYPLPLNSKVTYQQQQAAFPPEYPSGSSPSYSIAADSVFTTDYGGVVKHERDDSDLESNVEWPPSLHEYRASVSDRDNCTPQMKKQELLRFWENDYGKRNSCASRTGVLPTTQAKQQQLEMQRRLREKIRAENNAANHQRQPIQQHPSEEQTWASFKQKQLSKDGKNYNPVPTGGREVMHKSNQQRRRTTNVFQHNKPPVGASSVVEVDDRSPPPSPMLYRTQRHLASSGTNHNKTAAATYYPINLVAQSYQQTARIPPYTSHVPPPPAYHQSNDHPPQQQNMWRGGGSAAATENTGGSGGGNYYMTTTSHDMQSRMVLDDMEHQQRMKQQQSATTQQQQQHRRHYPDSDLTSQSYTSPPSSVVSNNNNQRFQQPPPHYYLQPSVGSSSQLLTTGASIQQQHQRASPVSSTGLIDDTASVVSVRSNPILDRVVVRQNNNFMTSPYMTRRSQEPQQHLHYPLHNYSKYQPHQQHQNLLEPPPYHHASNDFNEHRSSGRPYHRQHAASADDLLRRANEDSGTLV